MGPQSVPFGVPAGLQRGPKPGQELTLGAVGVTGVGGVTTIGVGVITTLLQLNNITNKNPNNIFFIINLLQIFELIKL